MTENDPVASALAAVGATAAVIDGETVALEPHDATAASAVPAEAKARLTDRLKKREVKKALVVLPTEEGEEPLVLLVSGLKSGQMDEIRQQFEEPDEDLDAPGEKDASGEEISARQAAMFRLQVTDPHSKEFVFAEWSDEDFKEMPLADSMLIMQAVMKVNGHTTEPGKDSPSTTADDSSSQ